MEVLYTRTGHVMTDAGEHSVHWLRRRYEKLTLDGCKVCVRIIHTIWYLLCVSVYHTPFDIFCVCLHHTPFHTFCVFIWYTPFHTFRVCLYHTHHFILSVSIIIIHAVGYVLSLYNMHHLTTLNYHDTMLDMKSWCVCYIHHLILKNRFLNINNLLMTR